MKSNRILLCGLTAMLIAGCATPVHLQQAQVGSLGRESAPAEVDRVLGNATLVARSEFKANGQDFLARQYRLQTGTNQEMTMVCTPACMPIFIQVPITADYLIIQRIPGLTMHAWGTPEQLSKDPDEAIASIMPTVKARLNEARQK